MRIIKKHINSLKESEYNPRSISKHDFTQLIKSLQTFGFVTPIIINSNKKRLNIIIGGHMRVKAARTLKIKEIPCIELNLNQEEEKELNIRLNRNQGAWDFDMLANVFEQQQLKDYGFTNFELSYFDLSKIKKSDVGLSINVKFKTAEIKEFEALKAYLRKKGYNYKTKLN